ncbi:heat shock protein DDB_G0288861-like isoform X1 [Branchiostoma lanceolatum]|uniref:heat shock protein DDB_G0288861-like isoform X1 n=1 Tax=Branchiostoma lanceolatum TaxID=7740 RepID=UPI003452DF13
MPNATRDENMQLLQQNQKTLEDLTKAVASLEAAIQQLQRHQQSPNLPPNPVHLQDVSSLSTQLQHPPTQGLARQSEREAPVHEKTLPPAVKDIQTRLDELTRSMTGIRSNVNSTSQAEVTQNDQNYHNSPALSIPCEKQVNIANLIEPWKRTSSPMPATTLHYPAQTVSNPIHKRIGLQHTATKGHHRSVQQSDSGKVNRQKTTFNSGFPISNASREVPYTIPSTFPLRQYGAHPQNTGQAYLEDAFTGRPAEKSREGGYVSNGVWRSHKDQIVPNVEIFRSHSLRLTPEIHIQRPQKAEATCSKAQAEEGQNGTKGSEQQHCTLEYQRQSLAVLENQQQNNQREADMHGCRENVQLSEEGHDISTVTQQPENTEQCLHDQETFHTYTGKEHMKKAAEMQCQKESSEEIEGQHQQHVQLTEEDHGGQMATQHLDQTDQCQQDQETSQTYDGHEHIKMEGEAQYHMESLEEKQQNEEQETSQHEYQQQPQLPGKSNDSSMATEQPDNMDQNQYESFQTNAIQEHIHIRKEGETDYQQKSHEKLEGQQQSTQREAENYKQLLQPEGSQGDSMVTQHSMDHVDQFQQEPLKAHTGQEHIKKEREMQCQKESLEELEDQRQNNQQNADSHQYHGQPQLPEETHNVQSSIQQSDELEQSFQEPCQTQTVQDHFKKEEGTRWQNESLEEHECRQQGNQQETDRHRYQEQHQLTEGTHDVQTNIQQSDNLDQCLQEPCRAKAVQDLSKEGVTQWQKESLERLEAQQRQGADRNEYKEQIDLPKEAHDSQSSIQQSNILDQRVQEPCRKQTVHGHLKKKEETHQYQSKSVEETEGPQQDNQPETDRNECQDQVQIPKESHGSAMVTQQPDNWKQRLRRSTQKQNVQEHKQEGKTDGQQPDQAITEKEPRRKRRIPSGDQSKSDPEEINASIKLRRFATMEMQKGTSKADHTKVILKTTKWAVINKPWTQLNKAQHDRLEEVFQVWKHRRVEKTLIFQLSEELNLPERQIKMWFYNRKEREAKLKEFLAKKTPDVFRCSTTLFDSGCPLDPLAALRTNPRQLSVEDCAVVVQHLQIQLNKIINP